MGDRHILGIAGAAVQPDVFDDDGLDARALRRGREPLRERLLPAFQGPLREQRASPFIFSISSDVAFRLASPITCSRMLPCPTMVAKLMEMGVCRTLSRNGARGTAELPSGPSTMVVTPSRR
jgi:hypothetical protein